MCQVLQRSQKLADSTKDKHRLYIVLSLKKEEIHQSGQAIKLLVSQFWSKVKDPYVVVTVLAMVPCSTGHQVETAGHSCVSFMSLLLSYTSTSNQWLGLHLDDLT